MRQRVKLKITTIRRITFYPGAGRARCPVCHTEVDTLNQSEAAHALSINKERLARLIATGRIHPIQIVNGATRVCRESLVQEQKVGRL